MKVNSAILDALNKSQKEAVETIDGPLMIIAGPGTGKTQLLSTRTANIVRSTDTSPSSILCLTYTDAAATEMRNRIMQIMGPEGGDVAVHTFHSFGSWIISNYPDYFSQEKALRQLDDISKYQIIESLIESLPFRHRYRIKDNRGVFLYSKALENFIKAVKQSGLSIKDIKNIHNQNKNVITDINEFIQEIYSVRLDKSRLAKLPAIVSKYQTNSTESSLNDVITRQLSDCIERSIAMGSSKPLGEWRQKHLSNKPQGKVLKTYDNLETLSDAIKLFEDYQTKLKNKGFYDYEDMINWATTGLKNNEDMLLDIAEQYQYIMVDEYQDTNGSQNALLDAIANANPFDSPNLMVVGDDDQAIMRFQGAEYSGMLNFIKKYNPKILVLTENYRSDQTILDLSREIINSMEDRLEVMIKDVNLSKKLIAKRRFNNPQIQHQRFLTPTAQYVKVADYIGDLIKRGNEPSSIAVICRKHKVIEDFSKFLIEKKIDFNYERRQSVLDDPLITQLIDLAHYVCALSESSDKAQHLLPKVLAAEYWQLEPLDTYRIASQARNNKSSWLDTMLGSENDVWKAAAEFLITLSKESKNINFTNMLDFLIGRQELKDIKLSSSPFKKYIQIDQPENYVRLLTNLIELRSKVIEVNPKANNLKDMIDVVEQYRKNDLKIYNSSPLLSGSLDGVQLLTGHRSKGQEFEHVIILSAVDNVWGKSARSNNTKIQLPENLPIYPAGDTIGDLTRLLYVAFTRAKSNILVASYTENEEGRAVTNLGLIDQEPNSILKPKIDNKAPENSLKVIETSWNINDEKIKRNLKTLLAQYTGSYKLSASALQAFLDVRYGGPQAFIEKSLLNFPSAYNVHTAMGSAAHSTIEMAYRAYKNKENLSHNELIKYLDHELDMSGLTDAELKSAREHAHKFMPKFIDKFSKSDFNQITDTEKQISTIIKENSVAITGSIDAVKEVDNRISIIDYKTGEPPEEFQFKQRNENKTIGLYFNIRQLYFYKLLIEQSPIYNKKIEAAELIFVESAEGDELTRIKVDEFDETEIERLKNLITAVSQKIKAADFPDISNYSTNLKGIKQFEQDLIDSI